MTETDLKPGENAARILAAIVESAVDGIVVIDARGRIQAFNPAAEQLFGYTAAEMMGCNVNVLMPPPYRREHDGYLARYAATGERHIIGIGRVVVGQRKDRHHVSHGTRGRGSEPE